MRRIDNPLNGHQSDDEVQHAEIMRLTPRSTSDQVQASQAAEPRHMPRSVLAEIRADLPADTHPAILISKTEDADAPDQLRQLARNITYRAGHMSPARDFSRFQRDYNDHRSLAVLSTFFCNAGDNVRGTREFHRSPAGVQIG